MKKNILLVVAFVFVSVLSAQNSVDDITKRYVSDSGASPILKTVVGADDNLVNVLCITYDYNSEDIFGAIHERLDGEGLDGSKKKNDFYQFKGVKYNFLWDKYLDFYVQVKGSNTAGTISLAMSQGYDNFINLKLDTLTLERACQWITSLDLDVQNYIYNNTLEASTEEHEDIKKELSKLKKNRSSIEKKISKHENKVAKFEASRYVVIDGDLNADPERLAKEQKKSVELTQDGEELQMDLAKINSEIDKITKDSKAKERSIKEHRANKPKSN